MPCSRVSSHSVALGSITGLQSNSDVWIDDEWWHSGASLKDLGRRDSHPSKVSRTNYGQHNDILTRLLQSGSEVQPIPEPSIAAQPAIPADAPGRARALPIPKRRPVDRRSRPGCPSRRSTLAVSIIRSERVAYTLAKRVGRSRAKNNRVLQYKNRYECSKSRRRPLAHALSVRMKHHAVTPLPRDRHVLRSRL